jgi:hypothetical protein
LTAGGTYPDLIDETYFLDDSDRDYAGSTQRDVAASPVTPAEAGFVASPLERTKKSVTFPDDSDDGSDANKDKVGFVL